MTDNYNGFLWTFIILLFLLFLICFYNDKLNLNISNSKELAYILILSILCFKCLYIWDMKYYFLMQYSSPGSVHLTLNL